MPPRHCATAGSNAEVRRRINAIRNDGTASDEINYRSWRRRGAIAGGKRSSPAKGGLALLHERRAALDIVSRLEAGIDRRLAGLEVEGLSALGMRRDTAFHG